MKISSDLMFLKEKISKERLQRSWKIYLYGVSYRKCNEVSCTLKWTIILSWGNKRNKKRNLKRNWNQMADWLHTKLIRNWRGWTDASFISTRLPIEKLNIKIWRLFCFFCLFFPSELVLSHPKSEFSFR